MAASESVRELLDGIEAAQQQDIADVTSGHLNENKLFKCNELSRHTTWLSARRQKLQERKTEINTEDRDLTNTMMNFMLGTTGDLFGLGENRNSRTYQNSSERERAETIPSVPKGLSCLMLPTREHEGQMHPETGNRSYDRKKQFIKTSHSFPTKKQQLAEMNRLALDCLHPELNKEKDKVTILTEDLHKQLNSIESHHISTDVPSYYRLKAHERCWMSLISHFNLDETHILNIIKNCYHGYIDCLMDSQHYAGQKWLSNQVELLHSDKDLSLANLTSLSHAVASLESKVMDQLQENQLCADKLAAESNTPLQNITTDSQDSDQDQSDECQLALLQAKVIEEAEAIEELQKRVRMQYIPRRAYADCEESVRRVTSEIDRLFALKVTFEETAEVTYCQKLMN